VADPLLLVQLSDPPIGADRGGEGQLQALLDPLGAAAPETGRRGG
jgi:hypothetical protein